MKDAYVLCYLRTYDGGRHHLDIRLEEEFMQIVQVGPNVEVRVRSGSGWRKHQEFIDSQILSRHPDIASAKTALLQVRVFEQVHNS